MDPLIPVPPKHYGGIERVIADLADALVGRGHQVTLWAGPGSGTRATLETFGEEGEWTRWSNIRNTLTVSARFIRDDGRFDVIHNFGRLAYLSVVFPWDVPKVQTYMRTINPDNMRKAARRQSPCAGPCTDRDARETRAAPLPNRCSRETCSGPDRRSYR